MNTKKRNKRNRNVGLNFKPRKDDIYRLRAEGKTYNQIAKILGCSKGTISYHCGKNQTEKKRVKALNNSGDPHRKLIRKITSFKSKCTKAQWRAFRTKIKGFKRKQKGRRSRGCPNATSNWRVHNISTPYTTKDVVNKIGGTPICYLTGRKINLNDTSSYTLDHRVPTTLGGTNDLKNLEICSTEANHAKAGLLLGDFYDLCEEILAWRDKQANK